MNIIEAVKSGKPYKRVGQKEWTPPEAALFLLQCEDLTANDWEVKEEKTMRCPFCRCKIKLESDEGWYTPSLMSDPIS